MLQKGQYVKLVFKNSTQLEGVVESYSNNVVTLLSEDKKSKMIVLNVSSDVMAIKVCLDKMPVEASVEVPTEVSAKNNKLENLEEQYEEVKLSSVDQDLKLKNLASLRKMIIDQEKNMIKNKMNSHYPSGIQGVSYGNPFVKKSSSK